MNSSGRKNMRTTTAQATNEQGDEWETHCPYCDALQEFVGYFDSGDANECTKCGKYYKVSRMWSLDGNSFIK